MILPCALFNTLIRSEKQKQRSRGAVSPDLVSGFETFEKFKLIVDPGKPRIFSFSESNMNHHLSLTSFGQVLYLYIDSSVKNFFFLI